MNLESTENTNSVLETLSVASAANKEALDETADRESVLTDLKAQQQDFEKINDLWTDQAQEE